MTQLYSQKQKVSLYESSGCRVEEEGKGNVSWISRCHSPLWGSPHPGAYTMLRRRLCVAATATAGSLKSTS